MLDHVPVTLPASKNGPRWPEGASMSLPSGSHEGIRLTQNPSCKGLRTRLDLGFASSAVQGVARE